VRLEELPELALGDGADEPAGLLTVAVKDEQRDAQDAVARGDVRSLVDVQGTDARRSTQVRSPTLSRSGGQC
jgi:hypothetical protein